MQLQDAKTRFETQGIKFAAISYDAPPILSEFAQWHNIEYPLLADADSQIIRSFNVFNSQATGKEKGMAHAGFVYIDSRGIVREEYFDPKETDRLTPNNVIGKLFPELSEEVTRNVEAPNLLLTLEQSDRTAVPGNQLTLTAEIELPPDVHVYAPGVEGYKPIQLTMQPQSGIEFAPVSHPASKILYLEAIQQHVPVSEGRFRIRQDATITHSTASDIVRSLVSSAKTVEIKGELKYQACDHRVCYPPASVPVTWSVKVLPLDLKRSPDDIRHK